MADYFDLPANSYAIWRGNRYYSGMDIPIGAARNGWALVQVVKANVEEVEAGSPWEFVVHVGNVQPDSTKEDMQAMLDQARQDNLYAKWWKGPTT